MARLCSFLVIVVALAGCKETPARGDGPALDAIRPLDGPLLDRVGSGEAAPDRDLGLLPDGSLVPDQLPPFTAVYYVDSVGGDDDNNGTSPTSPWKSIAKVQAQTFTPGTAVFWKRGGSWTGGLTIKDSGNAQSPIVFSVYGSGPRPVITNPGAAGSYTKCIHVKGSYVIVEGFLLKDAHEAGVYLAPGTSHNVVRDVEATDTGFGVYVEGQQQLVTQSHFHDLHMVNNTQGGDDDYGAVGVVLSNATGCEVSYNKMVNCKAPSYDYGHDGGVVEWWAGSSGNLVHHNWGQDSEGFVEIGGQGETVKDNVIAHNVSFRNGSFLTLHMGGTFGVSLQNLRAENNTIVEPAGSSPSWALIGFINATPTTGTLLLRNNILSLESFNQVASQDGFIHENNLYHLTPSSTKLGFTIGSGEKQGDPLFVDPAQNDYHLKAGSPAIDAGKDLGHPLDFDGHALPCGAAPDIGAFEFGC